MAVAVVVVLALRVVELRLPPEWAGIRLTAVPQRFTKGTDLVSRYRLIGGCIYYRSDISKPVLNRQQGTASFLDNGDQSANPAGPIKRSAKIHAPLEPTPGQIRGHAAHSLCALFH